MSCYGPQISTSALSPGTFTRMCLFLPLIFSPSICRCPYVACQEFHISLQSCCFYLKQQEEVNYTKRLCVFVPQLHLWFLETESARIITWNSNLRESEDAQPSAWNHILWHMWCVENISGKAGQLFPTNKLISLICEKPADQKRHTHRLLVPLASLQMTPPEA